MFYYPTALKRHTGCFSTIWLAATKGIKVSRRDYLKVNVKTTCDDIMDYVLVRVPPPQPGLPRPRFSLYLSSQLQYGVVVVYHHQCVILLGEIQTTLDRLTKHKPAENINLDDKDGLPLCVPDALLLLTETEGAQEPFFGVMTVEATMPSPCTLIQMSDRFVDAALPEQTQPPSRPSTQNSITASPDSITLREKEPVTIPTAEFEGLELPDHDLDMIELLLAQEEDFPEEGPVAIAEREEDMARELARAEEDAERDRTKEITGSTIVLQPTMVSSEEAIQLPQEETGPPAARPPPHIGEVTPVSQPPIPSLPGEEELETQAKRPSPALERVLVSEQQQLKRRGGGRRRRQLIFFDPDTQLNQEELQQRIGDPLTETQRPLLPPAPSHRMLPAAHLLTEPCNFLPEAIQLLWRQAATITPLSGLDLQVGERGVESTDSERDREAQREQDQQELQSVEIFRRMPHSPTSLSDISGQSVLPMETLDKALSRDISPQVTPESRGSPVSRSVSRLEGIPEEVDLEVAEPSFSVDLPGLPELPDIDETSAPLLFHTLMPPLFNRKTVSVCFWRLLEKVASRKLSVEQDEPYSDIRILPGPDYAEVFSSESLHL